MADCTVLGNSALEVSGSTDNASGGSESFHAHRTDDHSLLKVSEDISSTQLEDSRTVGTAGDPVVEKVGETRALATDNIQEISTMPQTNNMSESLSGKAEDEQRLSKSPPPEEPVSEVSASDVPTEPLLAESRFEGSSPVTDAATVNVQKFDVLTNEELTITLDKPSPLTQRLVVEEQQEEAPVGRASAVEDLQVELASTVTSLGTGTTTAKVTEEFLAALSNEETLVVKKPPVSISESSDIIAEGSSGTVFETEVSGAKDSRGITASEANNEAEKELPSTLPDIAISASGEHLATVSAADSSVVGETSISENLDVGEMSVTNVSAVEEPQVTVFDVDTSVVEETLSSSKDDVIASEEPQAVENLQETFSDAEILLLKEASSTVSEADLLAAEEPDADISTRESARCRSMDSPKDDTGDCVDQEDALVLAADQEETEDFEAGFGAKADILDNSDQDSVNGKEELKAGEELGHEEESDEAFDEEGEDDKGSLKGERQQGDGQESVDLADQDKVLDFDEDKRNPQYIPKKGSFYQHDDRMMGDEEVPSSQEQEKDEEDKGGRKQKKLWHDEGAWGHDMYREEEQAPKTSEELVGIYGYDIRSEEMPPRARRRRRYGRGPNKYVRNWEDEDAYAGRPAQPRGGGGRRSRGGPHTGSPSFREEDFPDLSRKSSGSDAGQDQAREPTRRGGGGGLRRGRSTPGWNRRPQESSLRQAENGDMAEESSRRSWPPLQSSREPSHGQGGGGKGRYGKGGAPAESLERDPKPMAAVERLSSESGEHKDGNSLGVKKEQANSSVPPKGNSSGGGEAACRPKRYSSLRQRPPTEPAQYSEPAVVAQLPNPQSSGQSRSALLTPAHFQAAPFPAYIASGHPAEPYPCLPREAAVLGSGAACLGTLAPGPVLPPAQRPPVLSPSQPPPPPVIAAGQLPASFLPPTGLVGFPAQYAPYSFPAQFTAPPAPAPPQAPALTQSQTQKAFYHGDITYYNTQSQQHKQRSTPPRRPKAAIPIVPPPGALGLEQEGISGKEMGISPHERLNEDLSGGGVLVTGPGHCEGLAAQQAVEL
ncbi:protein CASC3 isoform X1 [Ixodes scapularis]|uniref:protein CASC3 isoform X1 n=1 Tax=Ixodes scapularis TaxID=6945 RepID=UPI001A9DF77D|nr:protein CASC3 isoform X1 [Ixodes scapularis]